MLSRKMIRSLQNIHIYQINGSVHDSSNSNASAMELLQLGTKPSR